MDDPAARPTTSGPSARRHGLRRMRRTASAVATPAVTPTLPGSDRAGNGDGAPDHRNEHQAVGALTMSAGQGADAERRRR